MNANLIIPTLIYCGIAGGFACMLVLVQAFMLDITSRNGRWLTSIMPMAIVLGVMMNAAFSGRNLKLMIDDGTGSGAEVAWVARSMSAILFALAVAKIFTKLWEMRGKSLASKAELQHRALYIAFVAYYLGMYVSPMVLSAHPAFTYKGFFALAVFTAAYVSRKESLVPVINVTKLALLAMMLGSLAAAAVKPELAIESNYIGVLPGLHSRLWGLESHANGLGAMALLLLLLQVWQPSERKMLNVFFWSTTLAVFVLAQSKTTWLAGGLITLALLGYRRGLDGRGRPRMGFVLTLFLGLSLLAVGTLFVNVDKVLLQFEASDTGASIANLTGRTEIWAAAWHMWLDSPAFGYGLDAWSVMHRFQLGLPFAVHAHNQLMQALSVGGLAAAIPLLVYFVLLARASFQSAKRTQGISLALFMFIAMRCVSEAPMDVSGVLSGDLLCQLLLFMMVVNERPAEVTAAIPAQKRGAIVLRPELGASIPMPGDGVGS